MKILLIGSGGREHAIARKIDASRHEVSLFCAPGNPGTEEYGQNVAISDTDLDGLARFAEENDVDLTFVGPEAPLAAGIVDVFQDRGLVIVGPNKEAAQLESSKAWSKAKMAAYGIPTAAYQEFTDYDAAIHYVQKMNQYPVVIKADGLAAGKGVTVAHEYDDAQKALHDCFVDDVFSGAGSRVVIEEFLEGEEASIFAFTDGETIIPMVAAQDHKAVFDGDKGPNTGGMGAYTPAPVVTDAVYDEVMNAVFKPLIDGFKRDGIEYVGIVYAGLMVHDSTPRIVEFNARFGDPETQVVLPHLKTDLVDILIAMSEKRLSELDLDWSDEAGVCVVMASEGYPGSYDKGKVITGVAEANRMDGVHVIQAGTSFDGTQLLTNGGRVLGVVATGPELDATISSAYEGVNQVQFDGAFYRSDIGAKALKRL